ncbi:MAG: hypothetical protein FWE45_01135 [Firmicutes bacterium]|nr:hypothetical protein [Bacillota bacterium]
MKHLGVIVVFVLVAMAFVLPAFSSPYNPTTISASEQDITNENVVSSRFEPSSLGGIETTVMFTGIHNYFRRHGQFAGIYIHRPAQIFNSEDVFIGHINIDRNDMNFHHFEYSTLRFVNGDWVPTNWFSYNRHGDGVEFLFRKNLPAGRYAIRAYAYERYTNDYGQQAYRQAMDIDDPVGDGYFIEQPITALYEILFAEDLHYIIGRDSSGNNIYNARQNGLNRTIHVDVAANQGAMNKHLAPSRIVDGFSMGNIYRNAVVTPNNMEVVVRRGGVSTDLITVTRSQNGFNIHLPSSLPTGHFVVEFSHEASEHVFGTFVIDNSVVFSAGSDLSGAATAMFVIGTILAVLAIALFVTPKLMIAAQDRKYAALQNQRYMTEGDGAVDDQAYKAQTANDSLKRSRERAGAGASKSKSFLETMKENRAKREIAREHGLTMEEFRDIEKAQKKNEEAKVTGLQGFRQAMEEHTGRPVVIEEDKPKGTLVQDTSEVELLDSIAHKSMITDENLSQNAVQPNIAAQGSILSNIRTMSGDAHYTKREEISTSVPEQNPTIQPLQDTPLQQAESTTVQQPNIQNAPTQQTPIQAQPNQNEQVQQVSNPQPVQNIEPPKPTEDDKPTPPAGGGGILSRLGKLGE